jgi:hypothetical protein
MSVSWSRYDDYELAAVAGLTDLHLEAHPEQAKAIEDASDVVRALDVLIPATRDNLFSGNLVPIFEAERELQTSTTLARLGFYKQALSGLRSVLELGLLSVYWDANDMSHIDIQEWLAGRELTPQTYNIEKRLQEIPAVRVYVVEDPTLLLTSRTSSSASLATYTPVVSPTRLGDWPQCPTGHPSTQRRMSSGVHSARASLNRC